MRLKDPALKGTAGPMRVALVTELLDEGGAAGHCVRSDATEAGTTPQVNPCKQRQRSDDCDYACGEDDFITSEWVWSAVRS